MGCDYTPVDKYAKEREIAKEMAEIAWRSIGNGEKPKEAIEYAVLRGIILWEYQRKIN